MPSEHMRRKDDTWTSEELNKALKGPKSDMLRKKEMTKDDKKEEISRTEEERERFRQERRARREGGKEDTKSRPQEYKSRSKENKPMKMTEEDDEARKLRHKDKYDDHHIEKKQHRSEESKKHANEKEGERRKQMEDRVRRHPEDSSTYTDTTKRHQKEESSSSRRHRDDSSQHRHYEDNKDRQKTIQDESRHHSRKEKNDDEEERERRRQERRERREQENSKDKGKDKEKGHGTRMRNEKSERDHASSRHNKEIDIDKNRYHSRDKNRDKGHSDMDRGHEGKRGNQHIEDELVPKKQNSRHREAGRDTGKSRRQHNEESALVTSSIGQTKPERQNTDDDDEYNYEEDFEDYDEDFEEDEEMPRKQETEMEGVLRALDEENNKLAMASHRSKRSDSPEPSSDDFREDDSVHQTALQPRRSIINFGTAKQRVMNQALTGKARKRFNDLSRLIELDVVNYDMFDLQPVKEYEMYIRSFGRSDTKQACVQTRDDDIDRDIQTEDIETLSKWTQHPPDDETAVGGEGINVQGSKHKQDGMSKTDNVSLSQFMDRVGRIIFTILDEESKSDTEEVRERDRQPAVSFCNSVSQLGIPNFLNGRQVIGLSFCQSEPDCLLTVHSTPVSNLETNQSPLQNIVVICVWNLSQPAYPYRICGSHMIVTCACFNPIKASLVFAGMQDGSVALWDLREPSSGHRNMTVNGKDHLVRFPTYNTAGVLESENHHSPVVSIVPIYSSIIGSQKDEDVAESSSGLSFQLASVEEKSVVNLWVVAEVAVSDTAGSESDLGLSPGGKIKLLRSSSIPLSNPSKYLSTTLELRALNLHLDPSDLNHFYVGTDTGHIVHGVRFGKRIFPHSHCSLADSPVPVVSLNLSPFGQAYFLAGCEDGTLHLYHTKLGDQILNVRWSHSRPTVFFVLDNNSTVFTFDLVENGLGPIKIDKITAASVTSMLVGGDPNLLNPGTSRPTFMVLTLNNGTTEILTISDEMRTQQPLEEEFMTSYVDRY